MDLEDYFSNDEIQDALAEITPLSDQTKALFYKLLYSNIIAKMEAFLVNELIRIVLLSDESRRVFVSGYEPYQKTNINLSAIYTTHDQMDEQIVKDLKSIIYHELYKVKPIYGIMGIDIGEIGTLMKAVLVRHDIVHRNGKTKNGEEQIIGRHEVESLHSEVEEFITNIKSQTILKYPTRNQVITESDSEELPF